MQVHGTAPEPKAPGQAKAAHARLASAAAGSGMPRRRGRLPKHEGDDDDVIYAVDGMEDEEGEGEGTGAHRWSGVNRAERCRRRHGNESDPGTRKHPIMHCYLQPCAIPADLGMLALAQMFLRMMANPGCMPQ